VKLATIFAAMLFSNTAFAADTYLCIADKSAGFSFDSTTQQWDYARFAVEGKKYLLKKDASGWSWGEFGETNQFATIPCSAPNAYGILSCRLIFEVTVSIDKLRYQSIYPVGYFGSGKGHPEGSDNPEIEIGKCSAL
jgi:hypothetical protein